MLTLRGEFKNSLVREVQRSSKRALTPFNGGDGHLTGLQSPINGGVSHQPIHFFTSYVSTKAK